MLKTDSDFDGDIKQMKYAGKVVAARIRLGTDPVDVMGDYAEFMKAGLPATQLVAIDHDGVTVPSLVYIN